MQDRENVESRVTPRPGFIERTLTRLLMRPVLVNSVEAIAASFKLIHLQGESLRNCAWLPGHKIQVKLDGGLIARSYTPIAWDQKLGSTTILAYIHGVGPGSDWVRTASPGSQRHIIGPHKSLNLQGLPRSTILFGDETSFGLAAALASNHEKESTSHYFFEVNSVEESRGALEAVDIGKATLIERSPDDTHLAGLEEAISGSIDESVQFILSGKATSIQHVMRVLKKHGVSSRRIRTKAYWSPGKRGLD